MVAGVGAADGLDAVAGIWGTCSPGTRMGEVVLATTGTVAETKDEDESSTLEMLIS